MRRAVKTSADDELSLLLAVGRDAIGDVQVVPAGEERIPAEPLVEIKKDWSELRLADAGVVDLVALPGVQDTGGRSSRTRPVSSVLVDAT